MTVHVCPIKDSECGHRPDNWCDDCPLRAAAPQAQPAPAERGKCTLCGSMEHRETCDSPGAILTFTTGCPVHDAKGRAVARPPEPAPVSDERQYTEDLMKRRLYELMSDISEDCYCAGWMSGNEYTLWGMVSVPGASRSYGMSTVEEHDIAELRALSDRLGGWIVWWDDDDEPSLPSAEWGERFLPMAEWLKLWEKNGAQYVRMDDGGNAMNPDDIIPYTADDSAAAARLLVDLAKPATDMTYPTWRPISTAPRDFQVILTIHEDDLYPVSAYFDGTSWRREVEGPEDMADYPGKHDIMYHWPTHWMPLPDPPAALPPERKPVLNPMCAWPFPEKKL